MGIECVTTGKMIEVKTSDLTGAALDWATGIANDKAVVAKLGGTYGKPNSKYFASWLGRPYQPSVDWAQGGPRIDKHVTALNQTGTHTWWAHSEDRLGEGETALIAACRAIVAAKLGETVMVPAELVEVSA